MQDKCLCIFHVISFKKTCRVIRYVLSNRENTLSVEIQSHEMKHAASVFDGKLKQDATIHTDLRNETLA